MVSATPATSTMVARGNTTRMLPRSASAGWDDFSVRVNGQADYSRRCAGRLETGADSIRDPAMFGTAVGSQYKPI